MAAYARYPLGEFAAAPPAEVVGRLTRAHAAGGFAAPPADTTAAWEEQVEHLRRTASDLFERLPASRRWHLLLEYPLPRRSRRIDAVLLAADVVFVLEYKTGVRSLAAADRRQVEDYALDLRDFHPPSRDRVIVPVLVAPNADVRPVTPDPVPDDPVQGVHVTGDGRTADLLVEVFRRCHRRGRPAVDPDGWDAGGYRPVPTVVEAARHLYATHSVRAITRSGAGAENLTRTSQAVLGVIDAARAGARKAVCFVIGVPGAGKTLAGLNVVHGAELHDGREALGVFLSGNGPLVRVLTEALAADRAQRLGEAKPAARRTVGTFLQNVHGFLAQHGPGAGPPPDRVVVFDEAQRAWDAPQSYRKFRRNESEPAQMLRVMDRHRGWAVVVALVGNGQEINRGEAGLPEWGRALAAGFPHWSAHVADPLAGRSALFPDGPGRVAVRTDPALHLSVSLRAFRAGRLSDWVDAVLAGDAGTARRVRADLPEYPLALTRDLDAARRWLRSHARGERRAGLVASSGGRRLRPHGLDVTAELDEPTWFLGPPEDVRSSFLELAATEFAVQGLELDWAGVCWDADVRRAAGGWDFHSFEGTRWKAVRDADRRRYMVNKYRVLLTRAREGLVVWVPPGSADAATRRPGFYDPTADYLRDCGVEELA